VAYATPPEKLAARRRALASSGPPSLLGAALALLIAVPVWALMVVETLKRAWAKGSLFAALAPPRDPDALEKARAPWPYPVREFTVPVEGGRCRLGAVELLPPRAPGDAGAPGGGDAGDDHHDARPLALFLHGFPENAYSWRFVMPAVAKKGYRCVALSLRGYHGSGAPEGVLAYRMRRLADDVRDAAVHLGGGGEAGVTLVAHDWGGSLAWLTAALHPELVRRMVVLALPPLQLAPSNFTPRQVLRSLYILQFQAPVLPEASLYTDDAKVVGLCFTKPPLGVIACEEGPLTDGDVAVFRHAFCQPGRATAALNYYRALARWSLAGVPLLGGLPVLREYRDDALTQALRRPLADAPVLLLHGDGDTALGTQLLDGWEAVCAHAASRCYVLGRCSHWINQDRPRAVNELIGGWLPAA
jgi:pimeloyl-ACP methyl ester carboxylesterase